MVSGLTNTAALAASGAVPITSLMTTDNNNTVFYEKPNASTNPNETHAASNSNNSNL